MKEGRRWAALGLVRNFAVAALAAGCARGSYLEPDFAARSPRRIAILPFDAAGLVPDEAPGSGARFAALALGVRGCGAVADAAVLEAMQAAGMRDPGQAHCCVPELARRIGVDAVLLGRIDRFGAVGSSINFWRAVSNMADVRFNYSERGARQSRRYLSVSTSLALLAADGTPLWQGESSRWVDAARLPPLGSEENDLYRDMLYAVHDALRSFPGCRAAK